MFGDWVDSLTSIHAGKDGLVPICLLKAKNESMVIRPVQSCGA